MAPRAKGKADNEEQLTLPESMRMLSTVPVGQSSVWIPAHVARSPRRGCRALRFKTRALTCWVIDLLPRRLLADQQLAILIPQIQVVRCSPSRPIVGSWLASDENVGPIEEEGSLREMLGMLARTRLKRGYYSPEIHPPKRATRRVRADATWFDPEHNSERLGLGDGEGARSGCS